MNKTEFLEAFKPREKTIEIDGYTFRIRSITIAEREEWDERIRTNKEADEDRILRGMREFLICKALLDDDGNRMFEDSDMPEISNLHGELHEGIGTAIASLSGLTGRKEAVKN